MISEDQVTHYLRTHPDFFQQNPALIADLDFGQPTEASVSLVERQVAILRERNMVMRRKVNELMEGLWVAILIVIALIALTLGWREGLIVATAVPITFALTLLVNWLAGYSINRVTLFALTLALGLVVDDPIDGITIGTTSQTFFTDRTGAPGVPHTYSVTAFDTAGGTVGQSIPNSDRVEITLGTGADFVAGVSTLDVRSGSNLSITNLAGDDARQKLICPRLMLMRCVCRARSHKARRHSWRRAGSALRQIRSEA